MNGWRTVYKHLITLVFILSFSVLAFGQDAKENNLTQWYQLKSEEGGFSIKFPTKPNYEPGSFKIANIEIPTYSYSYELNKDGVAVGITYANFPAGFAGDNESSFIGAVSNVSRGITSRGGKIISQKIIDYKGCEGREIIASSPTFARFQGRIFISGQRFYIIICVLASKSPNTEEIATNFFNSLEIFDNCSGGVAPVEVPTEDVVEFSLEGIEDTKTKWRKLSVVKDSFSILMPATIKVTEETIQLKPFPISLHTYTSFIGNLDCKVIVQGEYPDGLYKEEKTYQLALDITYNSFKKASEEENSKIEFIRNLKVDKFPGREYSYISKGRVGKMQMFATSKRLYIFIMFRDTNNATEFDRFFNSVRISVK